MNNDDSWQIWSKHVLLELERLHLGQKELKEDVAALRTEVAMLKVKSGVWGAAAGLIPAIAAILVALLA